MNEKFNLKDLPLHTFNDTKIIDSICTTSHYDAETLLTKNGELFQTLEINIDNEHIEAYTLNLRNEIRKALASSIDTYNIAIYIHTIRSRKNAMPKGNPENKFANNLNDEWTKKNNFNHQLVNTIYITFIHQGLAKNLFNIPYLIKSLSFKFIKQEHLKFLMKAHEVLNSTVEKIRNALSVFGVRKLTLLETEEGFLSEPLMFCYQLLHMEERKVYAPIVDAAAILGNMKLNYEFDSIEIDNVENKRYAAIYSIKSHTEISTVHLNSLLQIGSEYIITQVITYVSAATARKTAKELKDITLVSKADEVNRLLGTEAFLAEDANKKSSYASQQTFITIFSDEKTFFEAKIKQFVALSNDLGLTCVREDFNMPSLFWAQLPGNFRFLPQIRFSYIEASRLAGYCSILTKDAGNFQGSKWGPPVTLLRSSLGTPFYFNFHDEENNGHTIIVGPKDSGKTVLGKFLITQALKFKPRILYLDLEGGDKTYVEAIGGTYYNEISEELKLNPFNLTSFSKNPTLFKEWLIDAIFPKARQFEGYSEAFEAIAKKIYEDPTLVKKVEATCSLITNIKDTTLNEAAKDFFYSKDKYGAFFTEQAKETPILNQPIIGINLASTKDMLNHYTGVLLEKFLQSLDGSPTIIYINNFSEIFNDSHFRFVVREWMDQLSKKNAILLADFTHSTQLETNSEFLGFTKEIGTKLFFSDKYADKYFKKCYELNDLELHQIKSYSVLRRIFLFKQAHLSKVLSINLSNIDENIFKILTSSQ